MTKTYPEVTIEELKIYHENPHNPRYRFQCPSCDRNYSREDNLKDHIKKSHDNEGTVAISSFLSIYSGAHISWHELFLAGNQSNHQNLVPSMLTYNL